MQHSTFDDFASFSKNEHQWLNELTSAMQKTMRRATSEPSKDVVKRISDYNRAYSTKRSTMIGNITMLLN